MTPETVLLRQVHPNFVQGNRVSSQVFRPTPKDKDLLSVYDGDMIDPKPAWVHFNSQSNCKSVGVMGVTVAECAELDLPSRPDPEPFPEHAVIDFSGYSKGQVEKKAKYLCKKAVARDWLYRSP